MIQFQLVLIVRNGDRIGHEERRALITIHDKRLAEIVKKDDHVNGILLKLAAKAVGPEIIERIQSNEVVGWNIIQRSKSLRRKYNEQNSNT